MAGGGGALQAGIMAQRGRDRAMAEQGADHLDAVRMLAQVDEADQVAELVRESAVRRARAPAGG